MTNITLYYGIGKKCHVFYMLIQYNLEYPNTLVIRIWESVRQFVPISEIKTFHNQNTQGILFLFIRMYF